MPQADPVELGMPAPGYVIGEALAIEMLPAPLVIVIPEPWVRVARVSVLPVVLPISNCPLVYVVCPVPPAATGNVPAVRAEEEEE